MGNVALIWIYIHQDLSNNNKKTQFRQGLVQIFGTPQDYNSQSGNPFGSVWGTFFHTCERVIEF
jgi:hypothetical protein